MSGIVFPKLCCGWMQEQYYDYPVFEGTLAVRISLSRGAC